MNRRSFLALLGLTGCIDINEDCMNINKKKLVYRIMTVITNNSLLS